MNETVTLKIAARELVEFTLRSGDLRRRNGGFSSALEGMIGHRKVQKSRGDNYQAEVTVRHVHDYGDFSLEIGGRIDGVFQGDQVTIEEIKTTRLPFDEIAQQAIELHLAQGKLYAWMYAREHKLESLWVQLTYFNVDNHETKISRYPFSMEELDAFFKRVITIYLAWAKQVLAWQQARDASLKQLTFPFPEFRAGQRRFSVEVFRSIEAKRRLFVQAPTGIGKTIGALFPALKARADGAYDKLFFLTAKTMGAELATGALNAMRQKGLKLKSIFLTAKSKVCFNDPCDPETCEYTLGYYDRIRDAIEALFTRDHLDRAGIEEVAREFRVCPFELSLDCATWCDLVVCDYNYVFDPGVYLRRFFGEEKSKHVLLVDEAHNLVDRARDMYTATLDKATILAVKRFLPKGSEAGKRLGQINRWFLAVRKEMDGERVDRDPPKKLLPGLHRFCAACEEDFAMGVESDAALLAFYFDARRFIRTAEFYDDRFRTIYRVAKKDVEVKIYNLDPSQLLDDTLKKCPAAVFFSATLTPFDYYARLLGGNPKSGLLRLGSPFPREHLGVFVADRVATTYRKRDTSKGAVSALIATLAAGRRGNYLVYFPSYAYLEAVYHVFHAAYPNTDTLVQQRRMDDAQRANFLSHFDRANEQTRVGFAVMGGAFGEGIDLVGDRLIGAVVVGVGLPQLCLERDLIRAHFSASGEDGFSYAYQYPGMNRVLQTAGRVIRGERDRGVVCLIDERFAQHRYRELFPDEWQPHFIDGPERLSTELKYFWGESETNNPGS